MQLIKAYESLRSNEIEILNSHKHSLFFFSIMLGCGRTFTGSSGVITSPNHPDDHPVSLDCLYLVRVPEGNIVTLSFSHFDLEPSESKLMT